jgi:hypothetical protein
VHKKILTFLGHHSTCRSVMCEVGFPKKLERATSDSGVTANRAVSPIYLFYLRSPWRRVEKNAFPCSIYKWVRDSEMRVSIKRSVRPRHGFSAFHLRWEIGCLTFGSRARVYHHSIYHTLGRAGLPRLIFHYYHPPTLARTRSPHRRIVFHYAFCAFYRHRSDDARFFCFAKGGLCVLFSIYTCDCCFIFNPHAVAMDKGVEVYCALLFFVPASTYSFQLSSAISSHILLFYVALWRSRV